MADASTGSTSSGSSSPVPTAAPRRRMVPRLGRGRRRLAAPRRRRTRVLGVLLVAGMLAAPVPWRHHVGDDPIALSWRLDGRLFVDGEVVDPPGRWSWLTVGRPPTVAEVLLDKLRGGEDSSYDMRAVPKDYQPALVEPAAVAVALRHAGHDVDLGLRVEVSEPIAAGYPDRAVVVAINGIELTDRDAWADATALHGGPIEFELADGSVLTHDGPALPYERVRILDIPPPGLRAELFGQLPDVQPVRWIRSLALGPSHGLMVALTTYAGVADVDLARGRHIAGTGGIRGDGSVTPIGGLEAKARAARRAGADVLVYPASQAQELVGFDAGQMWLVPVRTLAEAIEALQVLDELLPVEPDGRGAQPDGEPSPEQPGGHDLESAGIGGSGVGGREIGAAQATSANTSPGPDASA